MTATAKALHGLSVDRLLSAAGVVFQFPQEASAAWSRLLSVSFITAISPQRTRSAVALAVPRRGPRSHGAESLMSMSFGSEAMPGYSDGNIYEGAGLLFLCTMAAGGPKPVESSPKSVGTTAERVVSISKLLSKSAPLPSPLLDAHFIEEQTGDGRLGPSDFKAFYPLSVAPTDLSAWRDALSKSKTWNDDSNDAHVKREVPKKAQSWWVSGGDLGVLEF